MLVLRWALGSPDPALPEEWSARATSAGTGAPGLGEELLWNCRARAWVRWVQA